MHTAELTEQNTTGEGKRKWIYPLIRKGKWYKYRSWLSYIYLLLFFAGPFIAINGHPLLLVNLIERKFVLFGQVFWPQDFFVFVLAMLLGIVGITLFTIAFGRIFCGWICPQTIFMEMVFRKIEVWIEGDRYKQIKLNEGPLTREKIIKKTAKHSIFLVLSFVIANTFLAYLIGINELKKIVTEPVSLHWAGFLSIVVFTLIFYWVYSNLCELVCTVICPYGRLQSVLFDKHTLVVAYNFLRGEPRGKRRRNEIESTKGDCVDCNLCVDVCPTGIDIRNGTQLECISCTACIDACNDVMAKINRPLNLIGFYSEDNIVKGKKTTFTGRMMAYSIIMLVLMGVLTAFVISRKSVDVTILRTAGTLYQQQPGNYISNIYQADLINKANVAQRIRFKPSDSSMQIKYIQQPASIAAESSGKYVFFILVKADQLNKPKKDIAIDVLVNNKKTETITTTFIGPVYEHHQNF